ncbi:hypothetical protein L9F63_018879 [Diploptera punctata]|uniref:RING-type E3 ubiquitin transferase n=1 Tax=Diploptera punctata TaxID=6984 RepID=A0AAD8EF98_DIPPU|nr:hypothetical protein L9F63_018879 [Diploptera punctata]
MYVKVRTVDGKSNITVTVSKLTSVEEFRSLVEQKLNIEKCRQRFFYRGKQLEDGYRIFDYDIRLNDVIQLMVKPDLSLLNESEKSSEPPPELCKDDQPSVSTESPTENAVLSKYFKMGDMVDVRNISYGAWFEVEMQNVHLNEGIIYQVSLDEYEDDPPLEVTFEHIRPRARHLINFEDLKVGDVVMGNYNIENPKSRGHWYDVCITGFNKTRTKEIVGSIYVGKDAKLLENCKIRFCDEIYKIEEIRPVSTRSTEDDVLMQTETSVARQTVPNCSRCHDNPRVKCKECSCRVCGGKDDPGTQILCDECNMAYHIRCLDPPLESVPDCDEWYCPECKNDENEIVKAGEKLKVSKKKAKLPCQNPRSSRDWGKGMACVGRTKECTIVPPNHYGPIPGVEVGTAWLFRVQVSESGVHRPPVGGIHGRESDGAYSIVLSGGYEDDVDNGDDFLYTGSGGRDLSGNKRTAEQSCDQTLTRLNKALALNCNIPLNSKGGEAKNWKGGKPVRVVRNYKLHKHSKFAPEIGNRYDGIYKVVKYYPEKGKSGFVVWRYLLRRDDDTPAPWTAEGKKHVALHGLEKPLVPEGYLEANEDEVKIMDKSVEKSEQSKKESRKRSERSKKTAEYKLDERVKKLIDEDINTKLWGSNEYLKEGKQTYISKVAETFMCICCQELVFNPITTVCKHNMCKSCLKRRFSLNCGGHLQWRALPAVDVATTGKQQLEALATEDALRS